MPKTTANADALSLRRGMAAAAFSLCLAGPGISLAAEAPLQLSYSTDAYLTCDSLKDEIVRMDAIMAQKSTPAGVAKTARDRKDLINGLLKSKNCAPAPVKTFGPGMYD